ncbi:MAG: hypothetical protein IJ506_03720 [Clostridia bacterium]|nr:hypothetical protein [Clostridia bacterium]
MKIKKSKKYVFAGISACLIAVACWGVSVSAGQAETVDGECTLEENVKTVYARNDYLTIPQGTITVDGSAKKAEHTLVYPSGAAFTGDIAFLRETGEYKIVYNATDGMKNYVDEYSFSVENKMSSLFSYEKNVTVENGVGLPSYVNAETFEGANTEGVNFIVNSAENTSIRYNHVIDLAELGFSKYDAQDQSTAFIEFMFTPFDNGKKETSYLELILTDVYDESNYLTIRMTAGDLNYAYPASMYTKTFIKDGEEGYGWHLGQYTGQPGTPLRASAYGQPIGYETLRAGSFYFDCTELELWGGPVNNQTWLVMDQFDNPEIVGPDCVWNGFTTGEVYLTLNFPDISDDRMSFTVFSIGGKTISDAYGTYGATEILLDTDGYDLQEDYIVAGENMYFDVFNAFALAENYGLIDGLKTNVYFGADKSEKLPIENGRFAVEKTGVYVLEYLLDGETGKTVREIVLKAKSEYDERDKLGYVFPEGLPNQAQQGEKVFLPIGTVTGGIGNDSGVNVKVQFDNEEIEVLTDGKYPAFLAEKAGEYTVLFEAYDAIGGKCPKEWTVNVLSTAKPYITDPVLPAYFLIGEEYFFPAAEVFCCDETELTVSIGGEDYTNRAYTVTGNFEVVYKAKVKGADTYSEKSIPCTASVAQKGVSYLTHFFSTNNVSAENTAKGINFTATQDGSFSFVKKIDVALLNVLLRANEGYSSYEGLSITLTDSVNANERITLSFKNYSINGKTATALYLNGEYAKIVDGLLDGTTETDLFVEYDPERLAFVDENGKVLTKISYCENGGKFEGFTSGYAYVDFAFEGVYGETTLTLYRLASQTLTTLVQEDTASPTIIYDSQMPIGTYLAVGETFTLSSARAYDLFGSIESFSVKVVFSDGETVYSGNGSEYYTFNLTKEGVYTISYVAQDTNGKKDTREFFVYSIEGQPPVVTLTNVKNTAKVGKTYKFATASVEDDSKTALTVFFLDEKENRILVDLEKNTYIFKKAGKYEVFYYAVDQYNNFTVTSYVLEVFE